MTITNLYSALFRYACNQQPVEWTLPWQGTPTSLPYNSFNDPQVVEANAMKRQAEVQKARHWSELTGGLSQQPGVLVVSWGFNDG